MHNWKDKDFDWKGLNDAERDLHLICTRIGRLGGQMKEKYGTLRFYAQFYGLSLHTFFYPGYTYMRFPYKINKASELLAHYTGLSYLFSAYQRLMYKVGYRYILRKYPHLREEIGSGADYPELFAHKTVVVKEGSSTITRHYYKDGSLLVAWESL